MAKFKIIHDIKECIGCGACTTACPSFWEMKGDKSNLKGSKKVGDKFVLVLTDLKCNRGAADTCPVSCIHIEKA
jgi:ferredoxin